MTNDWTRNNSSAIVYSGQPKPETRPRHNDILEKQENRTTTTGVDIDTDIRGFLKHHSTTLNEIFGIYPNPCWNTRHLSSLADPTMALTAQTSPLKPVSFRQFLTLFCSPKPPVPAPEERPNCALGFVPEESFAPPHELDEPYTTILSLHVEECTTSGLCTNADDILAILGLCVYRDLGFEIDWLRTSLICIECVLGFPPGRCRQLLQGLDPVLRITGGQLERVEFLHKSFVEFLKDKGRSGRFHISRKWLAEIVLFRLIKAGFWSRDPGIPEFLLDFALTSIRRLTRLASPTPRLLKAISEIDFRKMRPSLWDGPSPPPDWDPTSQNTISSWWDVCDNFVESLSSLGSRATKIKPDISQLSTLIYHNYCAAVRDVVINVYFQHPILWVGLCGLIRPHEHWDNDILERMPSIAHNLPQKYQDLERDKGFDRVFCRRTMSKVDSEASDDTVPGLYYRDGRFALLASSPRSPFDETVFEMIRNESKLLLSTDMEAWALGLSIGLLTRFPSMFTIARTSPLFSCVLPVAKPSYELVAILDRLLGSWEPCVGYGGSGCGDGRKGVSGSVGGKGDCDLSFDDLYEIQAYIERTRAAIAPEHDHTGTPNRVVHRHDSTTPLFSPSRPSPLRSAITV